MAKKQAKTIGTGLKIEIISKSLYAGSGPRGVDVYARNLFDELSSVSSTDSISLSKNKPSGKAVDVTHYTFFDPYFLTLFGNKPKSKYIVTVHDLIPLKFNDHFPPGIRGKVKWLLQKTALKGASVIITDSVCSKKDIVEITGISDSRIYVVPLAAGHTIVSQKLVKTVVNEYSLPEKYVLYVGDINWNKNVTGLIDAFADIKSEDTHLVLVGKAFSSSHSTQEYKNIKNSIENSGKKDLIHLLGFVPSHHLPAIYQAATLYVQPSWYEGFGFPILEAMEQGTPILSADTGSLKEVGGEAVHYFNPYKQKEFVSILDSLLKDKVKRERFLETTKQWLKNFSWSKVAQETRQIYAQVASNNT